MIKNASSHSTAILRSGFASVSPLHHCHPIYLNLNIICEKSLIRHIRAMFGHIFLLNLAAVLIFCIFSSYLLFHSYMAIPHHCNWYQTWYSIVLWSFGWLVVVRVSRFWFPFSFFSLLREPFQLCYFSAILANFLVHFHSLKSAFVRSKIHNLFPEPLSWFGVCLQINLPAKCKITTGNR